MNTENDCETKIAKSPSKSQKKVNTELVLRNSIRPCTNGVSLLHRIACGASEQTADYVLITCPIHRAQHEARGLTVLDDKTKQHHFQHLIRAVQQPGIVKE